jgi:hypothetical protein
MKNLSFLLFIFVLAAPVPALAAIDEQGAAGLKAQVERDLQWRLDMTRVVNQGLSMEGPVTVTPKGSFYEVRIPDLSLSLGPEGKLDIGAILINAVPAPGGAWLVTAALPASMSIFDSANTAIATMTLGHQEFSGTWLPEKEMCPHFNSSYRDIRIKNNGAVPFSITIGTLKASSDMRDEGNGMWSGPSTYELADVAADMGGKNAGEFRLKKAFMKNTYDKLDVDRGLAMKKQLRDMFSSGKAMDESESKALVNNMLAGSQGMVEGAHVASSYEGFFMKEKTQGKEPVEFAFDKMTFDGGLQGARQKKSKAAFKNTMEGLKMPGIPADYARLAPHAMAMEMVIENLPLKKISERLFDALQKSIEIGKMPNPPSPHPAEVQLRAILASLPDLLQQSGATLSIGNSFIKSSDLTTNISGRIDANAAATAGTTGKMTVTLDGLPNVIQKIQALAVKPGADMKMMGYAGSLTALQMTGQAEKTPDGRTLHHYVFEITPDGKLFLNGADMQVLLKAGAALGSRIDPDSAFGKAVLPESLRPQPEQ